jgi:hypothetical protein
MNGKNLTILVLVVALFFPNGCSTRRGSDDGMAATIALSNDRTAWQLETDLTSLLGYRDDETSRLAQTVLAETDALARNYQVKPPALWHNFLVNIGIRDRGLCCHWTQDLLRKIETLQLQKYQAVWAVSRHGTWREHSCVVVTAAGQGLATGLVLDAWRDAGHLYWARVAEDRYTWQRHPGDNGIARIRCR